MLQRPKAGDLVVLEEQIFRANGTAVPIPSGATVTLVLRQVEPVPGAAFTVPGTLVEPASGKVRAQIFALMTAQAGDVYHYEFRLTDVQYQLTAPSDGVGTLQFAATLSSA